MQQIFNHPASLYRALEQREGCGGSSRDRSAYDSIDDFVVSEDDSEDERKKAKKKKGKVAGGKAVGGKAGSSRAVALSSDEEEAEGEAAAGEVAAAGTAGEPEWYEGTREAADEAEMELSGKTRVLFALLRAARRERTLLFSQSLHLLDLL